MARAAGEVKFSAPHVVEYAYRRSVGAVLGRFFTGLRSASSWARGRAPAGAGSPLRVRPDTVESVTDIGTWVRPAW